MNYYLDGLVVLVSFGLGAKCFDDGMVWIDFKVLLGGHVSEFYF